MATTLPFAGHATTDATQSAGLFARILSALVNTRANRLARQELQAMDARDLQDLGIARSDFDSILSGDYRR